MGVGQEKDMQGRRGKEGGAGQDKSIDLHGSFILADLRDEDLNPNKSLVTM